MSIIKESKYESASYFCIWYYQSMRGKLVTSDPTLDEAKQLYIDLFEDFTIDERNELETELEKLIAERDCIARFREKWISIGSQINALFEEFYSDDKITLTEEEKFSIVKDCDPIFLTSTIMHDEKALDDFIKLYYDIGKQVPKKDKNKISNYTGIKEEHILWMIQEYIYVQYFEKELVVNNCIVPKKRSIIHIMKIYSLKYKNTPQIQAIFKKIFDNPNLSLSKADKLRHPPLVV